MTGRDRLAQHLHQCCFVVGYHRAPDVGDAPEAQRIDDRGTRPVVVLTCRGAGRHGVTTSDPRAGPGSPVRSATVPVT